MAVIINEFEVVPDSAPAPAAASNATSSEPAEALSLEELNVLLRREWERQARVRAH